MSERGGPVSERREIGLKAIHTIREERKRSKHGRITGRVWGLAGAAVAATMLIAWLVSSRSLAGDKERLLAQQRAAVQTVGAEWFPLRDRLEQVTVAAAGPYAGDRIAPDAARWDFRSVPGIYLRLARADAANVASIRSASRDSLKDAFTGCLLRQPASAAAADGEADAGAGPDQPWNLRQAYKAARVLSDDWVAEVRAAEDKLRLRVFEQQYEQAKRQEIPLAIEIVKRAQFYLLVLDEEGDEAPAPSTDGGAARSEALQQVPHPARVHVFNLKTGAEIVRLRRTASADFVFAGERSVSDPAVLAAMKRQVNNCALAQEVWQAVRPAASSAGRE